MNQLTDNVIDYNQRRRCYVDLLDIILYAYVICMCNFFIMFFSVYSYKGWLPQWFRLGPHTILSFAAFEQMRRMAGLKSV